jgi:Ankyrin repeats (many copies)/Ankyrin repeats (3 copies)/Ankyrin repeat
MACNAGHSSVLISLSHSCLSHRFHWVVCHLRTLRHCHPATVEHTLTELPESLDKTYERILQRIPEPKREYARLLLQCLAVAVRPLRVEELATILSINFKSPGGTPIIDNRLRWADQDQAVLSVCSSLVGIVEDSGSHVVHFSHSSVREFLTSDRLADSNVVELRQFHIRLEHAHTVMAQACLSVLLLLNDRMNKQAIDSHHLARYAGKHFHDHAGFQGVLSRIGNGVDDLLNPAKHHFDPWVWLQIGDWNPRSWHNVGLSGCRFDSFQSPTLSLPAIPVYPPRVAPLYYVAALGHLSLTERLILMRPQDLDARDDKGCTPLHIAVLARRVDVSKLLIRSSGRLDIRDTEDNNLLHMAAYTELFDVARLLLERDGAMKALVNARNKNGRTPLHLVSERYHPGLVALLLKFNADVNAQDNDDITPLFLASSHSIYLNRDATQSVEIAQLLIGHGANVHMQNKNGRTPLHVASECGYLNLVELLLKFGAEVDARDNDNLTPLSLALPYPNRHPRHPLDDPELPELAQLLLMHGANVHVRNENG